MAAKEGVPARRAADGATVIETLTFKGRSVQVLRGGTDLFLWLHGSTQSGRVGRRFTRQQFDRLTEYGLTVAYPEGIAHHWNDARVHLAEKTREVSTDDVGYLRALAVHLGAARVFAGGFSNGGQMVYRLLHEAPGFLSGACVVAATQPAPENFLCSSDTWVPTPILLIQGEKDPIVPISGGVAAVSRSRGRSLSFRETEDYYRALNGDAAPVMALAIPDMGHVVPGEGCVSSAILGPASAAINTAQTVAAFFSLGGVDGQTR